MTQPRSEHPKGYYNSANGVLDFWKVPVELVAEEDYDKDNQGEVIRAINNLLFEEHKGNLRQDRLVIYLRRLYQLAKKVLPDSARLAIQRSYAIQRGHSKFPRWPYEDALIQNYSSALARLTDGSEESMPYIHFWPNDKDFCVVLTHDVETQRGFELIYLMEEIEKQYGFRSCWNIVPERYPIKQEKIEQLKADGFEIGIHGLNHDGKLFMSKKIFRSRVQKINAYGKRYEAAGFRVPLMHRNPEWMQDLDFEYDMSYFDTDPYQTQSGGCCSIFPFFLGRLVELPCTMPQDHIVFYILQNQSLDIWKEKLEWLSCQNGMVLTLFHPDYMYTEKRLYLYEDLLKTIAENKNYWAALPRQVALWWRERSESELVNNGLGWIIQGKASGRGSIRWLPLKEADTLKPCFSDNQKQKLNSAGSRFY
jgi:peptidoglycan/xylan/chitin deacetylase (PgdA/CDA1 family)